MGYDPSEYFDKNTKEEIKKTVLFFLNSGAKKHDEICEMVAKDFDVPKTLVLKILTDIIKQKTKDSN